MHISVYRSLSGGGGLPRQALYLPFSGRGQSTSLSGADYPMHIPVYSRLSGGDYRMHFLVYIPLSGRGLLRNPIYPPAFGDASTPCIS